MPAKFRELLDGQDSRVIYARASTFGASIIAGGIAWISSLHALVDAHDPSSELHDDFAYALLGDTVELSLDSEGRVGFPDELLLHAKLTDVAAFVGLGSYFEVWEPGALETRKLQARRTTSEQRGLLKARNGSSRS